MTDATARPIVFSDIDYTIVFDSELAPATGELIEEVRRRAAFVLVTARSYAECAPLPPIPSDGLVAENGAAVYVRQDGRDVLDREWDSRMARWEQALDGFREALAAEGWRIHRKLRAFSAGIEASGKSEADIAEVARRVPAGLQLQFSRNTAGRYLEVFPQEAGKDQAVFRVCADRGVAVGDTFGLGDNVNDADMLRVVAHPLAPGNCHPEVRTLVVGRGGYVSACDGHAGAQDILQAVLAALDAERGEGRAALA